MNILVRNLPKGVTENDLMLLFQPFGTIASHNLVVDNATGKSKGFGFVDMPKNSEAAAAIKGLDGKPIRSLKIRVKAAQEGGRPSTVKAAIPVRESEETWEPRKVVKAKKSAPRGARHATPKRQKKR